MRLEHSSDTECLEQLQFQVYNRMPIRELGITYDLSWPAGGAGIHPDSSWSSTCLRSHQQQRKPTGQSVLKQIAQPSHFQKCHLELRAGCSSLRSSTVRRLENDGSRNGTKLRSVDWRRKGNARGDYGFDYLDFDVLLHRDVVEL